MKKEYEDFLLSEYGNSRLEAVKISLGKYDFIVPYAYANPMGNYEEFEKALFSKYLLTQTAEIKKYAENGYHKIPTLRFKDTTIVCPYRLRQMEPSAAMLKVSDEINKRYNKAIRLTMALTKAFPDERRYVKVDSENVKKLNAEYNNYLLQNLKDKTLVSAAKMESIVKQKNSKLSGFLKDISQPVFKAMSQKYMRHLEQIKRIWNKNRSKIQVAFGATTLAALLTMGSYKPAAEKDKKEFTTEAGISPTKMINSMSQAISNYSAKKQNTPAKQKTKKGFDLLNKNVQEFLTERGLGKDQLNDVQRHNLDVFIKTQPDFKLFVAFAENFYDKAFDDQKGFATLGYGCTNYLDEKGRPLEKRGVTGKMSAFVQMGQSVTKEQGMEQVERVSYFYMLPKILEAVKVKLNSKKMFVTKSFAFVANKQFEDSRFVEALNSDKSNKYLSQCMAIWNIDAGIPKRFFLLHLVLNDKLNPKELINFKPVSCYNLTLDQCLLCKKNPDGSTKMKKTPVVTTEIVKGRKKKVKRYKTRPDYVMKNGMPQFVDDPQLTAQSLKMMRAEPDEKCVADIMPSYFTTTFLNTKKLVKPNYFAVSAKQNKNGRES